MAIGHWGSKEYVDSALKKVSSINDIPSSWSADESSFNTRVHNDTLALRNRISDLEDELDKAKLNIIEVPVEIIKEIKVIEEKIIEKEVQVIKEFPVVKDKIIKEFVDRPVEVIKEVRTEVVREVKLVPKWIYGILLVQTILNIILLFK